MTILRMDNVGIVFDDLDAAVAFFVELGLGRVPRMFGCGSGRYHWCIPDMT